MSDLDKWEMGKKLTPEEEPEYLKDLCTYLRQQQTLSNPTKNEDGMMSCEVVPDEVAAHVADVIEELWDRLQELEKFPKFMRVGDEENPDDYLEKCPNCGGPADNGFDRSWPEPNPYFCTKCMETGEYSMNRDDIFRITRGVRAKDKTSEREETGDYIEVVEFANLVAAAEREACARLCDELERANLYGVKECAAAIRARGEE